MITIKEIVEYMDSGKTFSCSIVAYDQKRKKGGKVIEYPEARLVQKTIHTDNEGSIRPKTKREADLEQLDTLKRNPNHREHFTRNIQILQDGAPTSIIRKIHPALIIKFNGQKDIAI